MSYSKPEQMNDQEFYISVQQGGTAALPCRVQSTPPPTLRSAVSNGNALCNVRYVWIIQMKSYEANYFSWLHLDNNCPTFVLFQLVSRQQQPAAASELRAEASLRGPHAAGGGREAGGRGPV